MEANMPNFNGTGPSGQGTMTGRGMGPCGRGRRGSFGRMGLGGGFGHRGGYGRQAAFAGAVSDGDTLEFFRRRAEILEEELVETRKVLKEMEDSGTEQ